MTSSDAKDFNKRIKFYFMAVDKEDKDRKALTVRIENELFNKIEQVAEELGQKSAAVARNYLKLSPYIIVNSNLASVRQKVTFMKTLGWFQSMPVDYLTISRKFAPPMVILSMVYQLIKNKRIPAEWNRINFTDALTGKVYKDNKELKLKIENLRADFLENWGNYNAIFDDQSGDYYIFDKIHLDETE